MKNKILNYKYEISVFFALCINFLMFFTKEDLMSDVLYPLHLIDLRVGFVSRTLIGSISGLLWEHPTKTNIFFMHTVSVLITFALVSIFFGICIKKTKEENRNNLFIMCLLVCILPYGFKAFINLFELLDIYWLMSIAIILLLAENKTAALFIPIFIFTGLWVHFSFVLAFMPVIYILYFIKCHKEKSKYAYILTGVMILISVPVTLFFLTTSRNYSVEFSEFKDMLIEKAGDKIVQFESYIGISFRPYDEMKTLYDLPGIDYEDATLSKMLYGYFHLIIRKEFIYALISDMLLIIPFVVFFIVLWKNAIKKAENKSEKFLYILALISPLIQVISLFTSNDTSRWLSLMMISNVFYVCLFLKENFTALSESLLLICDKIKKQKTLWIFVLMFYLSITFVW